MAIVSISDLSKNITDAEIVEQLQKRHPVFVTGVKRSSDWTSAEVEYSVVQSKQGQGFLLDGNVVPLISKTKWQNIAR
ncbi:hypothetical protein I5P86_08280 [Pseudomonas glycinae]|uniref:hypothetical protein n=1 Tax=Pseudomonas glycinae TaxID=1785145 RepID=UPI0018D62456|nr:hypothetical protein [Pseudomonas glycinae]MBH3405044.1 hypothetical protein [Pseudomonas glycinae]